MYIITYYKRVMYNVIQHHGIRVLLYNVPTKERIKKK